MKRIAPILFLMLAACGLGQAAPDDRQPSRYLATAVGRIDSRDEARQLVASADGVILRVLVRRGDLVRKGQVLLEVDCGPRQAQAAAARAEAAKGVANAALVQAGPRSEAIAAARAAEARQAAELANAERLLDRARALAQRGFVSQRELDARLAERDAALAAHAQAGAQRSELENGSRPQERSAALAAARAGQSAATAAQAAAAQCQLVSPIDGQVLQVLRREGEHSGASQGTPLLVVGDLSQRIVRAEVGERDVALIRAGAPIEVWIEGQDGRRWRGRVTEMAAIMGRRSARSLDPTDRFDRDVREVIVEVADKDLPQVVGLRVTVGFLR
jgi:HlyD family secretion protein